MKLNLLSIMPVLCIFMLLFIDKISAHGSKTTTIVKHTEADDPDSNGFWTRKTTWKSRWVKYWRPKAIYVPVWKKVWSPIIHNEWVPIPKPPPGWQKNQSEMRVREAHY